MDLLGMTVEEINQENSRKFGIDFRRGIVIVGVDPGSPAAKTGLVPGMIVQEVERQATDNLRCLKEESYYQEGHLAPPTY